MSAFLAASLAPQAPAEAQVSALPIEFSDVVVFGTNSVRLQNGARILAGHVVVNNASAGPTLTTGFELGIGANARTPAGYAIVGDSIQVGSNAVVSGNAFYNNLTNQGTISGSLNTTLALPVFSPLPLFQVAVPGTADVTVPRNTLLTLAPGAYRAITVERGATLQLGAGVYDVQSITTEPNATIRFENLGSGVADVRVAGRVTTGAGNVIGPSDGDPLKAARIIFYVGFAAAPGSLTPAAVDVGGNSTLQANVYAKNGTLVLGNDVRATGAFLARDVDVGSNARVDLETFFAQQAPTITSANATTFTVGQAGSFTVTTTGFPAPSITQGGALPAGVTFTDNGDGTGTLSGTPAAGTGGTYALTFTASNGVSPDAVQNFTLTIQQAPAITSADNATFTVGVFGSFTVTTTGFPAPSITQGGTLAAGVTFVDNGNGTATLSGTPAGGTGGTYALTFTAANAAGSAAQNFTLTVNEAPTFTSANATTFTVGQAGNFLVTTTGFPAPSIGKAGTLPSGVSFVDNGDGTGALSGTPAAGTGGDYPITFTATNAHGNAVQNFTLTVVAAPAAVDDAYTTDANTAVSRDAAAPDDLLDNDFRGFPEATIASFGGGSLGGTVTDNPAGTTAVFASGTLVVQSDGGFTFTPAVGFTGTVTFRYRLSNGAGTSDATVTIDVRPVAAGDGFPEDVVGNVIVNTATGTPFSVLANDVFTGSVTAALVSATSAMGGSVTLNTLTGTFTYNPPVGYQGADSFAYTITDGSNLTSAPANVALTVSGMIWFVNNNSGACPAQPCNGRLTNPFEALGGFTAVNDGGAGHPGDNHAIFVYESASAYTASGGVSLRTGQKLIGQDATASLATIAGVTLPTGSTLPAMDSGNATRTTIGSTVTLAGGSTVRGLTISTGSSTGLNGGAVTDVSVSEVDVTTTTGTAVNLNGTGGTVTLRSVSANGAVSGISLADTTGTFTVTGDGSTAVGGNGSGGTIQNTTSHGISLANAQNTSFTNLTLQNIGRSGVDGRQVTGFTFKNGTINNVGTASAGPYEESNIAFNDRGLFTSTSVSGTVTITDNILTNARRHGVQIENGSGTISGLTITGNTISSSPSASVSLGSGILVLTQGSATTTAHLTAASVANNTISNFPSGAGILVGGGSGNTANTTPATLGANGTPITITGNAIAGQSAVNRMGTNAIQVSFVGQAGTSNVDVSNNPTLANVAGLGVSVFMGGSVTGSVAVNGNTVVANNTAGSAGIAVQTDDGPALLANSEADLRVTINGNNVSATQGVGIRAIARASLAAMDVTINNNVVAAPAMANRNGIRVDGGSSTGDVTLCLTMNGNTSAGSGVNQGIGLRKQGTDASVNEFGIVGLSPSPATASEAAANVEADNPAGGGVDVISGSNFVSCTIAP